MESIVIPENYTGKKNDLFFERNCESPEQTKYIFLRACERLLNPNKWHLWAGAATACFQITDKQGDALERSLQTGDYVRIDIPGPGPKKGHGFDWVLTEIIDDQRYLSEQKALLGIKMSVCADPTAQDASSAAHFFKTPASSSFILTREQTLVRSSYHGRNETINNETESVIDNIRNTAVGAGAFMGFSELQWKALLEGLLQNDF